MGDPYAKLNHETPIGLARVRSKDQIHTVEHSPLIRNNRYGASAIIEAGREES